MSNEIFSSAVLASIITVFATLVLFVIKEFIEISSCYLAIMTELKVLKDIFENTFLKEITASRERSYLLLSYPLDTDYFTMYNSNCEKIGKIFIPQHRELIVATYTLAKYFLDCLRTNNLALKYYEDIVNGKVGGTIDDAIFELKHSFNNNILPTTNNLIELFEQIK